MASMHSSLPNTTTRPSRPRPSTPSPPPRSCGGDVHVLVAGANAAEAAQGRGADRRRRQGAARRRRAASRTAWPRTSPRRCWRSPANYSHILFPATAARQERRAARRRQARRRRRSPTSPRSTAPDTFERPIYAGNAIATVQSPDAIKVITVRTTGFDPAAATRRQRRGRDASQRSADSGKSQLRRPRDRQERPARADRRQDHRLRRPRAGLEREVQRGADAAGRQARRRARRQPRRGRRGLRAQRLAGRPDRQDRRAAALHRRRHLAARSSTWPA